MAVRLAAGPRAAFIGVVHNAQPKLRLPPRGSLVQTGPVDAIEQYYRPIIGRVFRTRLRWVLGALPARPLHRVLEVGYGSGVLQYSLALYSSLSIGVDPHPNGPMVRRSFASDGVPSLLVRADGADLPFMESSFDAVIVASTLEFVPDPERCLHECWRVLKPGGRLVGVTPRQLVWADAVYSLLTGSHPEQSFEGGRARVQDALARLLPPIERHRRPAWLPPSLAPYELLIWDR